MRGLFLLLQLTATACALTKRNYETHDLYAVHLGPHASPRDVAARLGLEVHGPLGELEHHYLLQGPKNDQNVVEDAITDLKRKRRKRQSGSSQWDILDGVLLNQKQLRRQRLFKREALPPPAAQNFDPQARAAQDDKIVDSNVQKGLDIAKSLGIADPIFADQWHLYNAAQIGHDINVTGVWQQGITGKNSTTCIVDDGLDLDSDDLKHNYFAAGSYDFNDQTEDPKPRLADDKHGTRCAGEVAAVKNEVCGVGVAYDSRISGVRILSAMISDADEAIAMNYAFQENQIYSCSWGPPDDGQSMEAPGVLIKRAMLTGIQKGRGGLGSIFVFAIGNGAANDDNCNFDGYTNSIYSVSVGGIDRKGLHPYYSEKCSAQLVVTYSSGSGDAIHTTDVGQNACFSNHGGTSAAGPLMAGAYALVLEVRPDLTWRDLQWLTVLNAAPVDEQSDWQDTTIGRRFSHQFGYGKLDTWALVEAAKEWVNVKPQAWYFSPWLHVKHDIPQGDQGLASKFDVTADMMKTANLERLEHVTVTMNVEHARRGDLSVELRSPTGIVSHIATTRRNDGSNAGYADWTFMSVAHFGESGVGTWTVIVKDTIVNEHNGTFIDWRLRFFGESIDAASQELLPLPTEHDDDDHNVETTSVAVTTTSHGDSTPTGSPEGNPSDHIDRPVAAKPTTTEADSSPTATEPEIEKPEEDDMEPEETMPPSNFLPSPFPTFGASKRTQVWIYGAIALIAIFCVSLCVWYILVRRRTRRNARDEYEFEMLNEEDADDDDAGAGVNGANGFGNGHAKKGKRRAGELYDAFAEGSDDEDVFSLGGDEEEDDGRYRDEADHEGKEGHGRS